jgi:hypothetical protein
MLMGTRRAAGCYRWLFSWELSLCGTVLFVQMFLWIHTTKEWDVDFVGARACVTGETVCHVTRQAQGEGQGSSEARSAAAGQAAAGRRAKLQEKESYTSMSSAGLIVLHILHVHVHIMLKTLKWYATNG